MVRGLQATPQGDLAGEVEKLSAKRGKSFAVFLVVFVAYLAAAGWLFSKAEYLSQEAEVRAGIARDVLAAERRGKEGLVCSLRWAPLPTLLYLPTGIIPGLIESGFAGSVLSALGGTLFLFYLYKFLGFLEAKRALKYLLLVGAAVNPWTLFSSVNGTSLMLLSGLLVGAVYHFAVWRQEGNLHSLIMLSLYGAALPLIRYQSLAYSSILLGGVLFVCLRGARQAKEVEGTFLLGVSPMLYGVGLWFLFNWLLMGNFVYFLRLPQTDTSAMSLWGGLLHSLKWMVGLTPLFPFAALLVLLLLTRRKGALRLLLAILMVSTVAICAWSAKGGNRFNFLECSLPMVPLSFIVVGVYLAGRAMKKTVPMKLVRAGLGGLVILSVVVSLLFGYVVLEGAANDVGALSGSHPEQTDGREVMEVTARDSSQSPTESPALVWVPAGVTELAVRAREGFFDPADSISRGGRVFSSRTGKGSEEEEIGEYIEGLREDCKVVIVGFRGYDFRRRAKAGERFIHLINLDMPLIIKRTRGKTLYLLVPRAAGVSAYDDINLRFPRLYRFGEADVSTPQVPAKAKVDRTFGTWRLFRVVRGEPAGR